MVSYIKMELKVNLSLGQVLHDDDDVLLNNSDCGIVEGT